MNENLERDAKVAMVEVGLVGYYSHRYIVDMLGLVSPKNAQFIAARRFNDWLKYYQPDYHFVHDPFTAHEISVQQLAEAGSLYEHTSFQFPGYRLLCRRPSSSCRSLPGVIGTIALRFHSPVEWPAVRARPPEGFVDQVTIDARRQTLTASGWAYHEPGKPRPELHIYLASTPTSSRIAETKRPDVVGALHRADLEDSGFVLTLVFFSRSQTDSALKSVCFAAGPESAPAPLHQNVTNCP